MVVGAVGDELHTAAHEPIGEGAGVVHDRLGVGAERRLLRLGEGDRFRGHDVAERTTKDERATLVDEVGELGLAEHDAAAGPRNDLWVVLVTTWACGIGLKSPVNTLPATRPAKWAMSTMRVAPTSSAISRMVAKLILRG